MQIQINWLLQKPTDLDLHCLQWQGISRFSRTRLTISEVLLSLSSQELVLIHVLCVSCKNYLPIFHWSVVYIYVCVHCSQAHFLLESVSLSCIMKRKLQQLCHVFIKLRMRLFQPKNLYHFGSPDPKAEMS